MRVMILEVKNALLKDGFKKIRSKGEGNFRLIKDNIDLSVMDQRYDNLDVILNINQRHVRIDFLLEYYFTQNVFLVNTLLRNGKVSEFYLQFINEYSENLAILIKTPDIYFQWERNVNVDEIRSFLM